MIDRASLKLGVLLIFTIFLTLLIKCSLPDTSAGNSTQTGNGIVVGRMYEPDGKTLANGAKIYLVPIDYLPYKGGVVPSNTYTTFTNDIGEYRIAEVTNGVYNLFAEKGEYVAYKDSIRIDEKVKEALVPPETLKIGGSICGKVKLEEKGDARTVILILMGTYIWSTPSDSSGGFTITNIPEGRYKLRILSSLDNYLPKDTVVDVISGKVDTIKSDIILKFNGIPVIEGLNLEYDTLKQIVTLRWNKPTTGRKISGYNVYRRNVDSNGVFIRINSIFITDTFYYDSSVIQDEMYEYKVTVLDENGNEGGKSESVEVRVSGYYTSVLSFGGDSMKNIHGIFFGFDSLIFIADKENSKIKVFDTGGVFLYQFGSYGDNEGQFNGLWDITLDKNGTIYTTELNHSRIQKFDKNGNFIMSWALSEKEYNKIMFFSIATYDTFLYVTEVYSPHITYYSTNRGNLLGEISLPGENGGWDITVNADGNIFIPIKDSIYLVDPNNKNIRSFKLFGKTSNIDPRCITIDSRNNIIVCQLSQRTIFGYSISGDYLFRFGSTQKEGGKIYFFSSIIIDKADNIYISDGDKGRILKYIKNKK